MPRKKVSPYQRYGKRPYRYSDAYKNWAKAILTGDSDLIAKTREAHNKFVGNRLAKG